MTPMRDQPRHADGRIKLLITAVGYPSEGHPAGAFHQQQFRAIAASGFDVTVVVPTPWVPPPLRANPAWKKYVDVPARQTDGDILILRPRYFTVPRENKWFAPDLSQYLSVRALRLPKPDLIHGFHILPLGAVADYLAHDAKVPFLTTALGDDVNVYPGLNGRNRRLLRKTVANAAKTFANGATLTDATARLTGFPVENLPIGVSAERYKNLPAKAEARARLGVPSDRVVALYVGRLVPGKGIEELAAAFQTLRQTSLLGVVIGSGPLADQLTGRDNVMCLGPKSPDDVAVGMAAADFLVLPSHSEGLPTVLMEAAFANLPIITTDAPGCIDLADDGRALVVPVGDVASLVRAFQSAMNDPGAMQARARTMLAYAQEYCSLERNTGILVEHYHAVLAAHHAKAPA
jgi:teichuronic acid biosynthesis glycosyltransferase TuaC